MFRDLEKVGVISGANTSTKEGEVGIANVKGLDGTIIESKIKLDYDKGLFWQMLQLTKTMTWDEYI